MKEKQYYYKSYCGKEFIPPYDVQCKLIAVTIEPNQSAIVISVNNESISFELEEAKAVFRAIGRAIQELKKGNKNDK